MNGRDFCPQLPQSEVFESVRQQQTQTGRGVSFLSFALRNGNPDSGSLVARIQLVQIDGSDSLALCVFEDEAHLLVSEQVVVAGNVQLQRRLADRRHLSSDPPFVWVVLEGVQKISIAGLHGAEAVLVILQHVAKIPLNPCCGVSRFHWYFAPEKPTIA